MSRVALVVAAVMALGAGPVSAANFPAGGADLVAPEATASAPGTAAEWPARGDAAAPVRLSTNPTDGSLAVPADTAPPGGVEAPLSVIVDGTTYTPRAPELTDTPQLLTAYGWAPAGGNVTLTPRHKARGYWGFLKEVTFGSLPEPATWVMFLVGFCMIGLALRGFIVANRRLARLRAEAAE